MERRLQLGRGIVGIQSPGLASFEILQQLLILGVSHIAGPDYLGLVDGSCVPYPFAM